ncbi:MAG: hypothetical protein QOG65_3380 [Actinomycetota bacterium]|nr:hypothetical protein [Actinomycetota bacterium]
MPEVTSPAPGRRAARPRRLYRTVYLSLRTHVDGVSEDEWRDVGEMVDAAEGTAATLGAAYCAAASRPVATTNSWSRLIDAHGRCRESSDLARASTFCAATRQICGRAPFDLQRRHGG